MLTSGNMQLPPLAIAMFPCDTFGCGYYRMRLPGRVLAEVGHAVHIYEDYAFPDPQQRPYDIYHFQRITTPKGLAAVRSAIKTGKPVLMDLDDDLFNLFPGHPSAWYFKKGKECPRCRNAALTLQDTKCPNCGNEELEYQDRLDDCSKAIQEVDVITVTTPQLAKDFVGAKSIEIIPNYVNLQKFDSLTRKGDYNTVVGWAGSFTHNLDVKIIADAIHIIEDHADVYFAIVGVDPQVIEDNFGKLFKNRERLITMDPLSVERYPEILGAFDIGLAPILDNKFNRAKSELKAEEYGAASVPGIYSNVAPYARYIEHGKEGFIARKPKEWKKYLRMLLEDKDLRERMAQNAYEKAASMDIRANIHLREKLYYELAMKKNMKPVWLLLAEVEEQRKKVEEMSSAAAPKAPANFGIVGGKNG